MNNGGNVINVSPEFLSTGMVKVKHKSLNKTGLPGAGAALFYNGTEKMV